MGDEVIIGIGLACFAYVVIYAVIRHWTSNLPDAIKRPDPGGAHGG